MLHSDYSCCDGKLFVSMPTIELHLCVVYIFTPATTVYINVDNMCFVKLLHQKHDLKHGV